MTLTLDHNQRLNLVFVLGSHDVRGRELHAVWHLQDTLDLSEDEKQAIDLRETLVNGQKATYWDSAKALQPRSFDFVEADIERIRKAMDEFPNMKASRDRLWAEPIYAQLPETNGAKASR
jgi:hypothetical protein